jgi:hypothetical protein
MTRSFGYGAFRDITHDELQADCLEWLDFLRVATGGTIELEKHVKMLGGAFGFIDVLFSLPQARWIIEIKSEKERWSGGSALRQLRYYRDQLLEEQDPRPITLALWSNKTTTSARSILVSAGVEILVPADVEYGQWLAAEFWKNEVSRKTAIVLGGY